jgi:hypothetical protein
MAQQGKFHQSPCMATRLASYGASAYGEKNLYRINNQKPA